MTDTIYNYEALPKKRMAAGALFLNEEEKILIVKPTYRPDWLLPGGSVEKEESPREACIQEIQEELCLEIVLERLLPEVLNCTPINWPLKRLHRRPNTTYINKEMLYPIAHPSSYPQFRHLLIHLLHEEERTFHALPLDALSSKKHND